MKKELDTKAALEALGVTVGIRHRKLAHREKTYLRIKAEGGHHEWLNVIMPVIRERYPDTYMTSGGFGVNGMNITVALEK